MPRQPKPNVVLRQLMAEHGFSLMSLAEALNTAAGQFTGNPGTYTVSHIHRWLSGKTTWPYSRSRRALEEVFGRPTSELGFRPPVTGHQGVTVRVAAPAPKGDQPVLRRKFAISFTGSLLPLLPESGRLGMTDVARIRQAVTKLNALGAVHGSGILLDATDHYIQHVQNRMRQCTYGPNVESRLYQLLGEIQALAGWCAFDAAMRDDTAARLWDSALKNALLARDISLQARIWSYMAREACQLRRGGEAVAVARMALDMTRNRRDPRLSALLHTRVAYGHAVLGDAMRSGQSLHRAELAFDKAGETSPHPWLAFFGPDELTGQASLCQESLGQHTKAVELRQEAINLCPMQFRRNQFLDTASLTGLLLAAGDPEEAIDTGHRALDMLTDVRSPRGKVYLAQFRSGISHYETSAAQEFTERYDAIAAATERKRA